MKISKNNYSKLNTEEIERYKRHLTLKSIGIEGQLNLKNSSVILIGAGGIGSSAILYLAAAGIGTIGIADNDQVEKSNLQRQIIHNSQEIGSLKTYSAKKRINELNPNCLVKTFTDRVNPKNILSIIEQFDIVCDCSDNFGTRYLINDACMILNKPFIYGSVQGFEGQISVFNLHPESPNLRDFIPISPQQYVIPSCEEFGVIGVSPGLIGILQANEIIKIIVGKGDILDGKIFVFDLLNCTTKTLNLKADNKNKEIADLIKFQDDYEEETCLANKAKILKINHEDFTKIYNKNLRQIIIIDVREEEEYKKFSLKGSISYPLSLMKGDRDNSYEFIKSIANGKKIYTLCQKGLRSEEASKILIKKNIESISIEGGIEKIRETINLKTSEN